jgi:hypothetical protein
MWTNVSKFVIPFLTPRQIKGMQNKKHQETKKHNRHDINLPNICTVNNDLWMWLIQEEYIPKPHPKSNDCIECNGILLPTSTLVRMYWRNMFHNKTNSKYQKLIVSKLHTNTSICKTCLWKIPTEDMENQHICTYCSCGSRKELKFYKGCWFLR